MSDKGICYKCSKPGIINRAVAGKAELRAMGANEELMCCKCAQADYGQQENERLKNRHRQIMAETYGDPEVKVLTLAEFLSIFEPRRNGDLH